MRTAGLASTLPLVLLAAVTTGGTVGEGAVFGAGKGAGLGLATEAGAGSGSWAASGSGTAWVSATAFEAVSVSNSTSIVPTATMSPTSPLIEETTPLVGDGIVTVALSVIISTIGASSLTMSPMPTCHCTTSPSTTPSPMSGSLKTYFVTFIPPWPSVSPLRYDPVPACNPIQLCGGRGYPSQ